MIASSFSPLGGEKELNAVQKLRFEVRVRGKR
jgi:hypothetical protein